MTMSEKREGTRKAHPTNSSIAITTNLAMDFAARVDKSTLFAFPRR